MKRVRHHPDYPYELFGFEESLLDFDKTVAGLGWNPRLSYGDNAEFYLQRGQDLRAQFWTSLLRKSLSWLKKIGSWSIKAFVALRRAHENRRAIRQLMTLSDYGLKDMGVIRGEVPAVVTGMIHKHGRGMSL